MIGGKIVFKNTIKLQLIIIYPIIKHSIFTMYSVSKRSDIGLICLRRIAQKTIYQNANSRHSPCKRENNVQCCPLANVIKAIVLLLALTLRNYAAIS